MAKVEQKIAKRRGGSKPGERRGGRQKGTPNKVGRTVKESVMETFERLGGVEHMTKWAQQNPGDFYRLAARLIPRRADRKVSTLTESGQR
jgi:hypothetical protein